MKKNPLRHLIVRVFIVALLAILGPPSKIGVFAIYLISSFDFLLGGFQYLGMSALANSKDETIPDPDLPGHFDSFGYPPVLVGIGLYAVTIGYAGFPIAGMITLAGLVFSLKTNMLYDRIIQDRTIPHVS